MGEDWREFRAKLVAREHAEGEMAMSNSGKVKQQRRRGQSVSGGKEEGGILGAFSKVSSIFSKGEKKGNEEGTGDTTAAVATEATRHAAESSGNIFDGDAVGGATKYSKIPSACSDPFMDEEECHLIYDEPDVTLDKHRWAHSLSLIEPGCILVANEKLGGVFHQTVVLIIDHNEATGSTGMVINR